VGCKAGDSVTLALPVDTPGNYEVGARFTRSYDFGRIRLELDGQPLLNGNFLDLYSPDVVAANLLPVGFCAVAANPARLTLRPVGKARASTGHGLGLDEVRLVPVR
jgi:hypothetical protein